MGFMSQIVVPYNPDNHPLAPEMKGQMFFRYKIGGFWSDFVNVADKSLSFANIVPISDGLSEGGFYFRYGDSLNYTDYSLMVGVDGVLRYNGNAVIHTGNSCVELPRASNTEFGVVKAVYDSVSKTLNIVTED